MKSLQFGRSQSSWVVDVLSINLQHISRYPGRRQKWDIPYSSPVSDYTRNMASPALEQVGRVFSSAIPFVSSNSTLGESLPILSLRSFYQNGILSWASLCTFLALWVGYCITGAIYRCTFPELELAMFPKHLDLIEYSVFRPARPDTRS